MAGSLAIGTIVNSTNIGVPGSNGALQLFAGGSATGATINNGGIENVFSGGTAIGTAIHGGGNVFVSSGGTTIGDLLIGSGAATRAMETLSSGGVASGAPRFPIPASSTCRRSGLAIGTLVLSTNVGSPGSNGSLNISAGRYGERDLTGSAMAAS